MKTNGFKKSVMTLLLLVCTLVLLVTRIALADPATALRVSDPPQRAATVTALLDDPLKENAAPRSFWRDLFQRSVFPNTEGTDALDQWVSSRFATNYSNYSNYDVDARGENPSLTQAERDREKDLAREQSYAVLSNMALKLKPIAQLRSALEPFATPVKVYKTGDGGVDTELFSGYNSEKHRAGKDVKLFSLGFSVSASHNLNLSMDIGERLKVSFTDGSRIDARYMFSNGTQTIGFKEEGGDKFYLVYGLDF